jgi:glutaredoxin 3
MTSVQSFVDNKISSNKVMVFSADYCPYCTKAKNVLKQYSINSIEIIELDNRDDFDDIMKYLGKLTGGETVCCL